jgi:alpha-1,2-mannosyltransferase
LIIAVVGPMIVAQLTVDAGHRLVDLAVYRAAGESLLIGRPVYDYLTPLPQLLPFTYPPFSAILAIPLALVPPTVADVAWTLGELAVLAWLVLVGFRPLLRQFPMKWRPLAFAALFSAMCWLLPVRDCFRYGQVGLFLAALCVLDCTARKPRWPRGALIGLATAIKLTPGVFIVYFWLTGRRKEARTAALWALGLTLATFLATPQASIDFWTNAVIHSDRLGANNGTSNQALRGMLLRALPEHWVTVVWLLSVAIVASYGFRMARREAAAGRELAAVVIVGFLSVLLSPVAWIHHLAGFLPLAIAVLIGDGRSLRAWWMGVGATVFFALSVPWYGATLTHNHGVPGALSGLLRDGFGIGALVLLWLVSYATSPRLTRSPVSVSSQLVRR